MSKRFEELKIYSKKTVIKTAGIFLLLTAAFPAISEPVSKITFSGLKKTKTEYTDKLTEQFINAENSEETLHQLENVLQADGLFDNIKVTLNPEDPSEILVSVKEKITFMPLPFFVLTDEYWLYGGMVINMNAFGKKAIFLGGAYQSNTSIGALLSYSKPAVSTADTGYGFYLSAQNHKQTFRDIYEEDFVKIENTVFSGNAYFERKFTPATTFKTGGKFKYRMFNDSDDNLDDYTALSLYSDISYSKSDWNNWFLSGRSVTFSGRIGEYVPQNDFFATVLGKTLFQHQLTERLRFNSAAAAYFSYNRPFSDGAAANTIPVTILPSKFNSSDLTGTTNGFEVALKKFGFGLVSFYSNYQLCYVRDVDDEMKFCQGFASGFRMFLSKIAFPAVSVEGAYNLTTGNFNWTGSIGVSF